MLQENTIQVVESSTCKGTSYTVSLLNDTTINHQFEITIRLENKVYSIQFKANETPTENTENIVAYHRAMIAMLQKEEIQVTFGPIISRPFSLAGAISYFSGENIVIGQKLLVKERGEWVVVINRKNE
jgi:hypothetical protein